MFCGTKRKIKDKEGFEVKCKDTPIETVTEVKYLGLKIDETVSGEGIGYWTQLSRNVPVE